MNDNKRRELIEAIILNDAEKIRIFFFRFFSQLPSYQDPLDVMTFNTCILVGLLGLGFDVKSETLEPLGRINLYFPISYNTNVIFAITHAKKIYKLTKEEENLVLADLAFFKLEPTIYAKYIAEAVEAKLGPQNVKKLLKKSPVEATTDAKRYKILSDAAKDVLSAEERNLAAVKGAREKINQKEIEEALMNAPSKLKPSPLEINNLLKSSLQEVLNDVNKKISHSLMGFNGTNIITLGLSSYDCSTEILAKFGS